MNKNGFLLTEKISRVKKIFTSKKYMSPTGWKISVSNKEVGWWNEDSYGKNWRDGKVEKEELIQEFNNKLKPALQDEDYEEALKIAAEAENIIEKKEEIIFSRKKYEDIRAVEEMLKNSIEKEALRGRIEPLKDLHRLNPFSDRVKKELDDLEEFHIIIEEIEKEEDPYKLSKKIKNAGDFMRRLPGYLTSDFEKRIVYPLKKIEVEIAALVHLSAEEEDRGELSKAIELLKGAGDIEFDTGRKERIILKISDLEKSRSQGKLLKYITIIVFVLIIIILYFVV